MKYLTLLLLIFGASISHAKDESFIREYSYKASDLDSKVSARNNTLKLIKAGVLEEIISYVHNTSSLEQSQSGNEFRSAFVQKTSSSSAGYLKARILHEHWDGFEMTIRAEISADPEIIRQELERALANQSRPQAQAAPARPPTAKQQAVYTQPAPARPQQPLVHVPGTTADYSGYVRAAQLTEVVVMLQPLKLNMMQYYMMNGEWPSSLADIRLKPEEMTDGQYLDKVRLDKDGRILAYLSDTFGKNKVLSIAPRSIMGGMQTRWDCTTNVNTQGMMGMGNMNCKEDKQLRYN